MSRRDTRQTRRAGAAVPFSPGQLANLRLWLRGDLGITLDGSSNVSQWNDQSGNGNNFSQGTPANRPNYNVNPFNNQPTVRFVAVNSLSLVCANTLSDPPPFCIIAVFSPTDVTTAPAQIYSSDGTLFAPLSASSGAVLNACTATANLITGTKYCFIANTNSTPATDQYLNGTLQSGLAGYTRSGRGATKLGVDAGAAVQFWPGDLAELIYYSRLLSSSEIISIRGYVTSRYGFSA